jgi:hypothetical protein
MVAGRSPKEDSAVACFENRAPTLQRNQESGPEQVGREGGARCACVGGGAMRGGKERERERSAVGSAVEAGPRSHLPTLLLLITQ